MSCCQDHLYRGMKPKEIARRWFLQQCGVGLGAVALTSLLGETGLAAPNTPPADPMAPKKPHFAPKAKRVIFLFMAGAPSHLELFDYKPQLAKFDGTLPPADLLKGYRAAFINPNSKLLGPKFKFARYGQSGAELSELVPHFARIVDEVAIVKSMVTDAFNHAHQLFRDGVPHANQRPRVDGSDQGAEGHYRDVRRRARQAVFRQQLPAGAPPGRARCPFRAAIPRILGPAFSAGERSHHQLPRYRQALRGAGAGPEAARNARRHAGALGRGIRPHADGA